MEHIPLYNIRVGQYQLLRQIDSNLSVLEQNIYVVAALKDITYEEASKIRISEFNSIVNSLEQINIDEIEHKKVNNTIYLNGEEYHIEHRPNKLTSGQLLDIINLRSNHDGEAILIMDLIMAALSRPKGKEYGEDGMTLHERAKYCREVQISEVWNVFVFFWTLWRDYLKDTEDYLQKSTKEWLKKVKQILESDGDYSA